MTKYIPSPGGVLAGISTWKVTSASDIGGSGFGVGSMLSFDAGCRVCSVGVAPKEKEHACPIRRRMNTNKMERERIIIFINLSTYTCPDGARLRCARNARPMLRKYNPINGIMTMDILTGSTVGVIAAARTDIKIIARRHCFTNV
jgi:hypothetical protein